jgi:predicted DNA-binding protein YlxM (UPF0122 family)
MLISSSIADEIAREASKLDTLEQRLLLTRIRVMRLKKKRFEKLAARSREKSPSLKQIDQWKHASKLTR